MKIISKTGFILEAIDEKLQLVEKREHVIRKTAGWMDQKEASELRENMVIFETIQNLLPSSIISLKFIPSKLCPLRNSLIF
jgi:hypothetical protein